jgi:hypothetical protein
LRHTDAVDDRVLEGLNVLPLSRRKRPSTTGMICNAASAMEQLIRDADVVVDALFDFSPSAYEILVWRLPRRDSVLSSFQRCVG